MEPSESKPPKVFISYSHDSQDHEDRVLHLADQLRKDGVDALIDQYQPTPRDGWPLWMDLEIQRADFVLMVCTDVYLRRVEHREIPGKGRGVLWEANLIYTHLYINESAVQKFIPVLLADGILANIPTPLRALTYYSIDKPGDYENLYRYITDQPRHLVPALGQPRTLPAKEPQSYPSSFADAGASKFPAGLDQRNRSAMLKRVRQDWIDGVLNQSLYNEAKIELGLLSNQNAVERSCNASLQVLDEPPTEIPPGTATTKIFDDHGGALLILGAPGTGKTTLLLELARGLLDRAEHDPNYPIPVVLNLSTWSLRRRPLAEWLVTELNERNDVPKKIAQSWVENEQVLPLLDGLDEVAANHRQDCAIAINNFRREHGLLPIAVCSRISDYESLGTKLRLRHAVVVEPLTQNQVQDYLTRTGEILKPLREAVSADAELAKLLQTPLMLWVAMLAYRNGIEKAGPGSGEEPRANQLFSSFVDAMFKRKGAGLFSKTQTLSWLSWLAAAMVRKKQSVFYLENLQLEWFPTRKQRILASCGIVGASGLLLLGVIWLGLTGELLGLGHGWLWWGLQLLLVFMLLGWVVGGLLSTLTNVRPVDAVRFRFKGFVGRARTAIRPGIIGGLLLGFLYALIAGLVFSSLGADALRSVLISGVASIPFFGFFSWLVASITTESVESRRAANQGTSHSLKNALLVMPLIGLVVGLLCGVTLALVGGVVDEDPFESIIPGFFIGGVLGLIGGLIGGLIAGGLFAAKQFVLRFLLWISDSAPIHYLSFLDYASERLFLRKVGGGYIFIHRSLLEHLAQARDADGGTLRDTSPRFQRAIAVFAVAACLILGGLGTSLFLARESRDATREARVQSYIPAVELLKEVERKSRMRTASATGSEKLYGVGPLAHPLNAIEHVVVIMLEQRSFDHMLGGLKSIDARIDGLTGEESNPDEAANAIRVQPRAEFYGALKPSPDRSFPAVDRQIFGYESGQQRIPNMQGFVRNYATRSQPSEHVQSVMYYFQPEKVPVLTTLALEYAVCDRWFSSVPGPLVPNHAYADYGTSFGRVDLNVLSFSEFIPSIYERLVDHGKRTKVYQYDRTSTYVPQFFLTKQYPQIFGTLTRLLEDAQTGNLPQYSFVEPDYSDRSGSEGERDLGGQSTEAALSSDEFLVAQVYNAIRKNQPLWHRTVLLITYSNHGGFYDHVPPPAVTPDIFIADTNKTQTGVPFRFDRLGVRVPAIIVSPFIPRGTVDHTVYEHASIPATVSRVFGVDFPSRSPREVNANTFDHVLSLSSPRADSDTIVFQIP